MSRGICQTLAPLVIALLPVVASAQSASAPPLETVVRPGDHIAIETVDRRVVQGRLLKVSPAGLELHRAPFVPMGQVRRVYEQDRLSDGAKRGALIGLVAGASLGIIAALDTCGDQGFINLCNGGGFIAAAAILGGYGAGFGVGIGVLADAVHSSRVELWRAPGVTSPMPLGLGRRAGVVMSVRW